MTKTRWYGGVDGTTLMPTGYITTSYISVFHECPSPTLANGYVDTDFQKVFNTNLKFRSGTLKVYINLQEISQPDFTPIGDESFRINIITQGYITISYLPSNDNYYYGNHDVYENLVMTTNVIIRYFKPTITMLDRMRYAINELEVEMDLPQTRWTGGAFSDTFNTSKMFDDGVPRSNFVSDVTEITPQMYSEMQAAIEYMANRKTLTTQQFNVNISSEYGIDYNAIEWCRRYINELEVIV